MFLIPATNLVLFLISPPWNASVHLYVNMWLLVGVSASRLLKGPAPPPARGSGNVGGQGFSDSQERLLLTLGPTREGRQPAREPASQGLNGFFNPALFHHPRFAKKMPHPQGVDSVQTVPTVLGKKCIVLTVCSVWFMFLCFCVLKWKLKFFVYFSQKTILVRCVCLPRSVSNGFFIFHSISFYLSMNNLTPRNLIDRASIPRCRFFPLPATPPRLSARPLGVTCLACIFRRNKSINSSEWPSGWSTAISPFFAPKLTSQPNHFEKMGDQPW